MSFASFISERHPLPHTSKPRGKYALYVIGKTYKIVTTAGRHLAGFITISSIDDYQKDGSFYVTGPYWSSKKNLNLPCEIVLNRFGINIGSYTLEEDDVLS